MPASSRFASMDGKKGAVRCDLDRGGAPCRAGMNADLPRRRGFTLIGFAGRDRDHRDAGGPSSRRRCSGMSARRAAVRRNRRLRKSSRLRSTRTASAATRTRPANKGLEALRSLPAAGVSGDELERVHISAGVRFHSTLGAGRTSISRPGITRTRSRTTSTRSGKRRRDRRRE